MEIAILGSGCSRCKALEQNARKAADELGVKAQFVKIMDIELNAFHDMLQRPRPAGCA